MKKIIWKILFSLLIFVVNICEIYSQTIQVSGNISAGSTPARYASITFIDEADPFKNFSEITDSSGKYQIEIITTVKEKPIIPQTIELAQNYPNTFNPTTNIGYSISTPSLVNLSVFDVLGRKIKTLVNSQQKSGIYSVSLDGSYLSSGCYCYQLKTNRNILTKKMVIVR